MEEKSPLLRLSPELRNLIYEFALTEPTSQEACILLPQPALTRTCNRIRQESLLLYYTLNDFHLSIPRDAAYLIAQALCKSHFLTTEGRRIVQSIPLLKITYHLSSMENMPASLGVGFKVQGGWVDLAEALARVGFQREQVEWKAVSDRRFSHPALGGNYYHYLAESARVRVLGEVMMKDWDEAVKRLSKVDMKPEL
ncbi:hypothetical protein CKM354_000551200 [Cercospora kikuchii]|uniref:Uncharacterized protein n=1 Tax=Cercospora kikuchii TaxID=84275 RepID=A0A9P3CGE1_9PEZI|nr:uncharacterized protein CKM354_000551200 [Cercospora kikuchii]GIZ42236.1 hypothetical protein CKM354_000551200 [Cercospora kikuchii]